MELENKLFRIEEMVEQIKETIENLDKMINDQIILIDVVDKSEMKTHFEEFIEGLKNQNDQLITQRTTLYERLNYLNQIIDECKEDESKSKLINKFIAAFGMFNE